MIGYHSILLRYEYPYLWRYRNSW